MFYSHEILTSPEHGVATVWLVATLGSRSISRRLNRKTILDVDVPKACGVIMDPVAPMALRLQSNLLYGISRVYSQQCGYTLVDVQAMHDKMRAMLRSLPAGGLDPAAGKARPDQLVLPYDPSFLPENNLPGLGLNLSKLDRPLEVDTSQQSSAFWPQTPNLSQTALSGTSSLRLNLPSDDNILKDMGGLSSEAGMSSSIQRGFDFGRLAASDLKEDGGVLLQPDFEFDEDGNIIELGGRHQSEQRATRHISEGRGFIADEMNRLLYGDQPMLVDEDFELAMIRERHEAVTHPSTPKPNKADLFEPEDTGNQHEVIMRQRQRLPKILPSDNQTALRNSELACMADEYMKNMKIASKQKRHNKIPTQAKKNAAYWVLGVGIGSVGAGVGSSRATHPLHSFSGNELYVSLVPDARKAGHKRPAGNDDSESPGRRVRARKDGEDQMGNTELIDDNNLWNEDVEIGRRASPALHDDNSSQMPWNITASIQSSRHGSSAANILRGFGSVSDFSSRGIPESAGPFGIDSSIIGLGRARNRLTSASPLAGRGFPFDISGLNSLSIPGNDEDDLDKLEGFDLSHYLETEAMVESNPNAEDVNTAARKSQVILQNSLSESVMDEESLNFLGFLAAKIDSLNADERHHDITTTPTPNGTSGPNEITFATLLPPEKTSRAVATHGLVHILALATKGFLSVHQSPYEDHSSEEHGARYEYGEISLRLSGM